MRAQATPHPRLWKWEKNSGRAPGPRPGQCRRQEPPAAACQPSRRGALTLVMPLTEEVMILTVSMVTLWTIFSSRSL